MLNLEKCNFSTKQIHYLGHVIQPGNMELADHTTDHARALRPPHNVLQLKLFLRLCNVYSDLSHILLAKLPAQQKAQNDEPRTVDILTQKECEALATLQHKLRSAPVLPLSSIKEH